jgi:hypothetical protein
MRIVAMNADDRLRYKLFICGDNAGQNQQPFLFKEIPRSGLVWTGSHRRYRPVLTDKTY